MYRRELLKLGIAAGSSFGANRIYSAGRSANRVGLFHQATRPLFVATWKFGQSVCERAVQARAENGSMLDAIEKGIHVAEADQANASVGIGGIPNSDGVVQLDAVIMSGPNHAAGAVAGIEDILHPISVARKVMEQTPHVMLVGDGAKKFAVDQGFAISELLTENQKQRWQNWKQEQRQPPATDKNNHDTITLLGLDEKGDLYAGCSTSGWGYKTPGRVGDSPIVGAGLYVDNQTGAAGATGTGENVMRHCGSFLVVEFMRQGHSPEDACVKTIQRIASIDPLGIGELSINFIAINKAGEHGAAGTNRGFVYAIASPHESSVVESRGLTNKDVGPEGGNRK